MIDLHIHTDYSDGTWNLKKVLKECQKANLDIISITDHNTVDAYIELESFEYKEIFDGELITGIEISTVYDGIAFHMLVYDFDYKIFKPYLDKKYNNDHNALKKEFNYMFKSCKKNNIKIGEITYSMDDGWPIDIIYPEIKKHKENKKYFEQEEWDDIDIFFNSCITKKDFPVFLDMNIHYPDVEEVVEEVKKAGGKTFIAHLYKYNLKYPIEFLDKLVSNDIIDGIEVEHSLFTNEQTLTLKEYCVKNKLLMSGGSDSHGDKNPNRKVGIGYGNMKIENELIKDWY